VTSVIFPILFCHSFTTIQTNYFCRYSYNSHVWARKNKIWIYVLNEKKLTDIYIVGQFL
jgi:hypothetical protein